MLIAQFLIPDKQAWQITDPLICLPREFVS
jgi:hypothetical protein